MTSPFDPRNWLPRKPEDSTAPPSWLDLWMDATTWWVEPATRASESAARASAQMLSGQSPEQMLADLVDGVARRFAGNRIEVVLHGRPAKGRLDSIRVFRKDDRYEAKIDVSDGSFDGVPIEQATITVRSLRIDPGVPSRATAEGITITGRAALEPLIAWVDTRIDDWTLSVSDDARGRAVIAAPHEARYRGASFVVDGTLRDNELHVELRGARWRMVKVGVPGWLRFTRTIPIRELSSGLRLDEATRRGDVVDFRLSLAEATGDIDLMAVRDAIVRGTRIIIG